MRYGLVTGGASGLGLGLVELLANRGYSVALFDINDELGTAAAEEFSAHYYNVDVSDQDVIEATIDTFVTDHGVPQKAFLNAGIMSRPPEAPIEDDPFDWLEKSCERVMGVNVYGALYGLRALVMRMAENGGGDIVVTSSVAGLSPLPFDPYYAMSKHALVGMVQSFAPVLEARNIRLNAFCPGLMNTRIVPDDLKALENGMTGAQASESCFEVSEQSSTGTVWVREGLRQALRQYVFPKLDV